jgi:hypothetical protein
MLIIDLVWPVHDHAVIDEAPRVSASDLIELDRAIAALFAPCARSFMRYRLVRFVRALWPWVWDCFGFHVAISNCSLSAGFDSTIGFCPINMWRAHLSQKFVLRGTLSKLCDDQYSLHLAVEPQ